MDNTEFKEMPELTDKDITEIKTLFPAYLFFKKVKRDAIVPGGVFCRQGANLCICTACEKTFEVNCIEYPDIVHNGRGTCPKCGVKVEYKNMGRGKKCLNTQRRVVVCLPKDENEVWLRAFYVSKIYCGWHTGIETCLPKLELDEVARCKLRPREKARYWSCGYSYTDSHRIFYEDNPHEPFHGYMGYGSDYIMLIGNIKEKSFLRYIDLDSYSDEVFMYHNKYDYYGSCYGVINERLIRFMCEFAQYPIMESLIKAGFGEFVAAKVYGRKPLKSLLNWEADTITDFFRTLSKNEIKSLRDCNYKIKVLKVYSLYSKIRPGASTEEFLAEDEGLELKVFYDFLSLVKKYKLKYRKARNYINSYIKSKTKQKNTRTTTASFSDALGIYSDYLTFAKRLGYNLKNSVILYPLDLDKKHDEAAKVVAALQRKQEEEKMREFTNKLKKRYSFEYGKYMIIVPESMQDIIDEGEHLSHCVGSYAERHANGKLAILFIRKKSDPDKSYVTMEVHGTDIYQFHGYDNERSSWKMPKSVKDFVKEFQRYICDPKKYKAEKEKKAA